MNGVNGTSSGKALKWSVGLINNKKYLTAETFGSKINLTGTALKKKQFWTIEQDTKADVVYFKSHLGRYLAGDKHGNVTCTSDERENNEQFAIEARQDGRWLIRNVSSGLYFGGSGDDLHCNAKLKDAGEKEMWTVHLGVHPQVNLRNVKRDRYAHLAGDELLCNEIIPWGQDALITIEFMDVRDDRYVGLYAVKTCDGRYLSSDGTLTPDCSDNSLYRLEIHSGLHGGLAFRDHCGKYLTNVGSTGSVKTRNSKVSADELYILEDSHPQTTFIAHNNKYVSIKQGIDVTANQLTDEVSDKETFQIEFNKKSNRVSVRTCSNKYWSLESNNGIREAATTISSKTEFDLEWHEDGSLSFKAINGNYVTAKMNGALYATVETPGDKEKFKMTIINRPIIVLRGSHGFVGLKRPVGSGKVECNRSTYDMFTLQQEDDGSYSFKGNNGKYWMVEGDGSISATGDAPTKFILEFRQHSKFAIKAPNGNYVKGEQNGIFSANGTELNAHTLWEY